MRARKTRHRRNNSRGSNTPNTTPVKTPSESKDAVHIELIAKAAQLGQQGEIHFSPSSFKFLGPGTAIREIEAHHDTYLPGLHSRTVSPNMNDVCFGCDGQCKDPSCTSQRSTPVSAPTDMTTAESSTAASPIQDGAQSEDYEIKKVINPEKNVRINEIRNSYTEPDHNSNIDFSTKGSDNQYELETSLTSSSDIMSTSLTMKRSISDINDVLPNKLPTVRCESTDSEMAARQNKRVNRRVTIRVSIDLSNN